MYVTFAVYFIIFNLEIKTNKDFCDILLIFITNLLWYPSHILLLHISISYISY